MYLCSILYLFQEELINLIHFKLEICPYDTDDPTFPHFSQNNFFSDEFLKREHNNVFSFT